MMDPITLIICICLALCCFSCCCGYRQYEQSKESEADDSPEKTFIYNRVPIHLKEECCVQVILYNKEQMSRIDTCTTTTHRFTVFEDDSEVEYKILVKAGCGSTKWR